MPTPDKESCFPLEKDLFAQAPSDTTVMHGIPSTTLFSLIAISLSIDAALTISFLET